MITILLAYLIGLIIGYYANTLFTKVIDIHRNIIENKKYKEAGVVRPGITKIERPTNEPIDLSSATGGVRRKSPKEYVIENLKERERYLKNHNE